MADLHFVVPGNPDTHTGGFIYDRRMVEELRKLGLTVELHSLPDGWPYPGFQAVDAAEHLLARLPDGARVIIDGLALGVLPRLAERESERLRLIALVHHPLAEETGLDAGESRRLFESEHTALSHVHHVIATSAFTAQGLVDYDVTQERMAGQVKARGERRRTRSDWMQIEQQRGISVTTSVMTFEYDGVTYNLLDTPGHEDFSEDTYRTLTAVDSAIMAFS